MSDGQLPLRTAPFVRGSKTSQEAAESLSDSELGRLEQLVFDCIRTADFGRTDDEMEQVLDLSHQTVSARRRGLVQKGHVCDSGVERTTRSGRKAVVWIVGRQHAEDGTALDRATRPSNDEIRVALRAIDRLVRQGKVHGFEPPAELKKLWKWLVWISKGGSER